MKRRVHRVATSATLKTVKINEPPTSRRDRPKAVPSCEIHKTLPALHKTTQRRLLAYKYTYPVLWGAAGGPAGGRRWSWLFQPVTRATAVEACRDSAAVAVAGADGALRIDTERQKQNHRLIRGSPAVYQRDGKRSLFQAADQ